MRRRARDFLVPPVAESRVCVRGSAENAEFVIRTTLEPVWPTPVIQITQMIVLPSLEVFVIRSIAMTATSPHIFCPRCSLEARPIISGCLANRIHINNAVLLASKARRFDDSLNQQTCPVLLRVFQ